MKYKKIPLDEFLRIYSKVPRAGVDIVVVSRKGFLLTKRSIQPHKGMWHIPGGSILHKEPIKHAVDRIVKEELGIKIKILEHLGIIEYYMAGGLHTVANTYLAKIVSGKPKGSEQGGDIEFYRKVPQNTIPVQKKFINKHLSEIEYYLS
ncbi:MAG: NUDIX hydrolase [Patescibacteria group bacterium]